MYLTTFLHPLPYGLSMPLQDFHPNRQRNQASLFLRLLVHFDIPLTQDNTHLDTPISTLHRESMDNHSPVPILLGVKAGSVMDGLKELPATLSLHPKMDKWVGGKMSAGDSVTLIMEVLVLHPPIITTLHTQCPQQGLFRLQQPRVVFCTLMEGQLVDKVNLLTTI